MASDDFLTYEQAAGTSSGSGDSLSYEEAAGGSEKPGMLARGPDEGYLSGLGKGAATATIKGLANIPGMAGNIRETGHLLGDYFYGPILG